MIHGQRTASERGFALVLVLWGMVILSVIAMAMISSGKTSYLWARNSSIRIRMDALAEAAVSRAILALVDQRVDRRWRVDGVPRKFVFDGITLSVRIQDELGRIDLNTGDQETLTRLLVSADVEPQAAEALIDKILDWRESNDLRRLHGANEANYRALGYAYRPRNGPFQRVDELKLVLGMTPQLFDRLEPALTVYSKRQFIDPRTAPREALLALPSFDAEKASALLDARTANHPMEDGVADRDGIIDPTTSLGGRAFTITVEIHDREFQLVREAVVRLTDDPMRPYWMLSWRERHRIRQ